MVYRFGNFELDCARYRLERGGEVVPIEPLALDLLAYLIERRARLVPREELLEALWAHRFVSDAVLARCVRAVRLTLGDDAEQQHFIQTVRGRGYGFVAEVEEIGDGSAAATVAADIEEPSLWEPAIGAVIPQRPHWTLERKLGDGGFGSVWLGRHEMTGVKRTFKFCFDRDCLHALEREVVLFRLLEASLGEREDITQVLDWQFEEAPYFVEAAYTPGGDLVEWSEEQGGLSAIPLATRVELVAQVAVALGAAHSAGVLHKDVKPSNILIRELPESGEPRASLTDFGIGLLTDRDLLRQQRITATGLTETLLGGSSGTSGTRLYLAPEVLAGRAPTVQSDLFSLGVVLYQIVRGDWGAVLAPGWRREIDDELLREDITACVDGDPERRLGSAWELVPRLRLLDRRRAERAAAARSHRRRRLLAFASLTGIALTLAVSLVAWRERRLRRRADDLRYVSSVQLAGSLLAQGNRARARDALLRAPEDLRGWEWGHLVDRAWPAVADEDKAIAEVPPGATAAQIWQGAYAVVVATLADTGPVWVRFDDSGTRLVSRSSGPIVKIWDLAAGEPLLTLDTGTPIFDGILSHDGRLLATTHLLTAVLWDAATGKRLHTLSGHTGQVSWTWFSPDDSLLVTSADDGTVRVWETASGRAVHMLPERTDAWPPHELRFLDDGARILVPSHDQSLHIWNLETAQEEGRIRGPQVKGLVPWILSPDGRYVLSLAIDHSDALPPVIWSATSGEVISLPSLLPIPGHSHTASSADGTGLAILYRDGTVQILETESGETLTTLDGFRDSALGLAWSPDGSRLAVGHYDGTISILAPASSTQPRRDRLGDHDDLVLHAVWSADGSRLATASYDHTVKLWDVATRSLLATFRHPLPVLGAELSPDGRLLRTAYPAHHRLWEVAGGELLFEFHSGTSAAFDLRYPGILTRAEAWSNRRFSPDGSRILLNFSGGEVRSIDTASGETVHTFHARQRLPSIFVYGPRGKRIVVGDGESPELTVWDARSGEELYRLTARFPIGRVEFSPDGSRLAAAGLFGIWVWDVGTGAELLEIAVHGGEVHTVRFDATGKRLVSAGVDPSAKVWDAETGTLLSTLHGHGWKGITNAAVSPDGTRILTVSGSFGENTFRIWDLDGRELLSVTPDAPMFQARFSPDGRTIATPLADGTVRLWETIPWPELAALGEGSEDRNDAASLEARLRRWRSTAR